MKLRGWLHAIAKLAHPVLALLGVKKGTVADKGADVVEKVDEVVPPDPPKAA